MHITAHQYVGRKALSCGNGLVGRCCTHRRMVGGSISYDFAGDGGNAVAVFDDGGVGDAEFAADFAHATTVHQEIEHFFLAV